MKFWFSGEIDHSIADAYRAVRTRVESRLNAFSVKRDYGEAVREIAIIPMILRAEFLAGRTERRLWQRKQRSADYRTIIDFEKFTTADDSEREQLLLANVAHAIRDLQAKIGADFRGGELLRDIAAEFGFSHDDISA